MKKEKGSLTVEATLVLPVVIITLLFLANILNICMVHVCMQQAINNTAKKISQDSYVIYRFLGENKYKKFIEELSNINDKYSEFEDKATKAKENIKTFQNSAQDTITSFEKVRNTPVEVFGYKYENGEKTDKINFDLLKVSEFGGTLFDNIEDLKISASETINNAKASMKSIKDLKDNIHLLALKMMVDVGIGAGMTGVVGLVFDKYRDDLNIPLSRLNSFNFLHSSLNDDGSFTYVITYKYENPFSFINKESMEYSIINKTIRMTNAITIKPFIGKNGTSLVAEAKDSNEENNDNVATESEKEMQEDENIASESEIKKNDEKKEMDEKLIRLIRENKFIIKYYHLNSCSAFNVDDDIYINIKNYRSHHRLSYGAELEPCEHCINSETEFKDDDKIYWLRNINDPDYHFPYTMLTFHSDAMCDELKKDRQKAENNSKTDKRFADECELSLDMFGEEAQTVFANYMDMDLQYVNLKNIKIDYTWEDPDNGNQYFIDIPCPYCVG